MLKKQPSRSVDARGNKPEATAKRVGVGRGSGGSGVILKFSIGVVKLGKKNQIGTRLFAEEITNFAGNFCHCESGENRNLVDASALIC